MHTRNLYKEGLLTNDILFNKPLDVLYELRRFNVWFALWQGDIPLLSSGESVTIMICKYYIV